MSQESPGRNDPCPCGSGNKYKKCHWSVDQKLLAEEATEHRQRLELWKDPDVVYNNCNGVASDDPCPCGANRTFAKCHELEFLMIKIERLKAGAASSEVDRIANAAEVIQAQDGLANAPRVMELMREIERLKKQEE